MNEPAPFTSLIVLDRDGVINEMYVDPEHGRIDSPYTVDQITFVKNLTEALRLLKELGFAIGIATNQPGAAKGLVKRELLEQVEQTIEASVNERGATLLGAEVCWHAATDNCECRKPKPAMLERLLQKFESTYGQKPKAAWMVGDSYTDLLAGRAAGFQTAFIGSKKCYTCKHFEEHDIEPDIWAADLFAVAQELDRRSQVG